MLENLPMADASRANGPAHQEAAKLEKASGEPGHLEMPLPFMTTKQAGAFLRLSPRTLEKHRVYGSGPIYRKLGGRVVYAVEDLQAWADLGARLSTSEKPKTYIPPVSGR